MIRRPQPLSAEPLLAPKEAARYLGVDAHVIYRWSRQGKFTRIVTPGGHSRLMASEVRAMRDALIDGAK